MDYIRWQKFLKECYFLKELLNESIMQKFFGHYGSARLMESNWRSFYQDVKEARFYKMKEKLPLWFFFPHIFFGLTISLFFNQTTKVTVHQAQKEDPLVG